MSMIEEMMTQCIMMDKVSVPDGLGGFNFIWQDGAEFKATVIKDSSPEMLIAEKQGITETYTIVTKSNVGLQYHDVFRRVEDGQIFRVTSNTVDSKAPAHSTVQIGKVTAEKWVIPSA